MGRYFQVSAKIGLAVLFLLFLVVVTKSIPSGNTPGAGNQVGYPAPFAEPTPLTKRASDGYPAPNSTTTAFVQKQISTPTVSKILDAAVATKIGSKSDETFFNTMNAVAATEQYMKSHFKVSTYQPTNFSMQIKSLNDLPNFVYTAPFFASNDPDFTSCIPLKKPGTPLLVKSLSPKYIDYYVLPFYKENKICGLAFIEIKNGAAIADGWKTYSSDKYPILDANEAIEFVSQKTGKKIVEKPILASGKYKETYDPFQPVWQVKTEDGEFYYVIFYKGISEDGKSFFSIQVFNSAELHSID